MREKGTQGFASMVKTDPERQRQLASEGGKAAQRKGTGYRWTKEQAAIAGRKGGLARQQNRQLKETS